MNPPQTTKNRLVPDEPFPPYSYVPGKFPHPTQHPRGHHHGKEQRRPKALDPGRWPESREYLWGIDLFNHGYYWEAHEAWEALWHAAGRRGPVADFLKGLIALAAAGVKAREGRLHGVRGHALRAEAIFKTLTHGLEAKTNSLLEPGDQQQPGARSPDVCRSGPPEGGTTNFLRVAHLTVSSVRPRELTFLGFDLNPLIAAAKQLAASPERVMRASDEPVAVVMPFALWPTFSTEGQR